MSNPNIGWRQAGFASVATALVLGASLAGAGSASAQTDFHFDRVQGVDRYQTAARAAQEYADGSADFGGMNGSSSPKTVIVANGEPGHYADALSANYLAGCKLAPILLTHTNVTPQVTLNKLHDLGDGWDEGTFHIIIVGGTGVVSEVQRDALDAEIEGDQSVTRIGGGDRFATNARVINRVANGPCDETYPNEGDSVGVIATGMDFPDALGAGPLAYNDHALGLSRTNDIDHAVVLALQNAEIETVIVLGGTGVVGHDVVTELDNAGIDLDRRIAGADRSETSTELADYVINDPTDNFHFSNWRANVASGYPAGGGADALAGGPMTGGGRDWAHPMLITKNVTDPGAVTDWLFDNSGDLRENGSLIFGGDAAVSIPAEINMENAGQ